MTDIKQLDQTQSVQEMEYGFPYHYLPEVDGDNFTWWPYWDWGYRYLTGIEMVTRQLDGGQFGSLLDVGCGDGRFLREIRRAYPDKTLLGIDYSETAIRLANAMNPHLDYRQGDINTIELPQSFDVVTLIEVLEHIPPAQVASFVSSLARLIQPGGKLVITVPHLNQPVIEKHYQHFDSLMLDKIFSEHFDIEKRFYFDKQSRAVRNIQRLLFNKFYVVRHQGLLNYFFRRYRQDYLACEEADCQRVGYVMTPK